MNFLEINLLRGYILSIFMYRAIRGTCIHKLISGMFHKHDILVKIRIVIVVIYSDRKDSLPCYRALWDATLSRFCILDIFFITDASCSSG